jgi:ABC-type transporter Mla subunit MlaD
MTVTVRGTIERLGFGAGTWALTAEDGKTYEIYQGAPAGLLQAGQRVEVVGIQRDDVMTIAMIGPVLAVVSFEVLA